MKEETKIIIRSLSVDTYPYFPDWIEIGDLAATGFIGNYERKTVSKDWSGPKLEHPFGWRVTERDRTKADCLVEAMTQELNTSDLNVCHSGDLKEETEITAVALAITSLKTIFPTISEFGDHDWSGVLRALKAKEKYTDLSEDHG